MKTSRVLLIVIVATGVVYIGSFAALGSSFPTVESSGQEIIDWFASHGANARTYAWMAAFISLGLAVFGGIVSTVLPRPHRYIFLGGVLGGAITVQVQAWFWAGLALHPGDLEPGAARTIFDIPNYWGPLFNGSTTTMAVAVVVLGFGATPLIPRWLTWLSAIFFLEQGVETVTVFGESGFMAPGGSWNVYVGGVIGFAWVAGLVRWAMHELDARSGHADEAPASVGNPA
jgi:hypothetical protein